MKSRPSSTARRGVWAAVILLAIVHQDFWLWGDATLVGGVLPVGLVYHMVFSLVAAAVWILALKFAWPVGLEEWAEEGAHPREAKKTTG